MSKLSKLRAAVMTLFRDGRNKRDRSLEIGSVSLPRVVFSCRTHEYFFATLPRAAWLLGTKGHALCLVDPTCVVCLLLGRYATA